MTRLGTIVVALALASCGGGKDVDKVDMSVADLSAKVDMASGALGATCSVDTDCGEGSTPTCFVSTLFNESGKLATAGGYCSSKCSTDADCGSDGTCRMYTGESTGWCFASCTAQAACRPSYGCFLGTTEYCFPSGNLDCDPTEPAGACSDAPDTNPGSCLRAALGTGDVGICYDGCTVGAGSCAPLNGENRQCIVYNQTGYEDPNTGISYGDKLHGTLCIDSFSSNADGAECASTSGGTTSDNIAACVDGDECWLASAFHGDNRCHKLCTGNVDGGSECPAGQSCEDVFGLLSAASPVGLCH